MRRSTPQYQTWIGKVITSIFSFFVLKTLENFFSSVGIGYVFSTIYWGRIHIEYAAVYDPWCSLPPHEESHRSQRGAR